MGKKNFLRFFLRNPLLRRVLDPKKIVRFFFCVLGFILLLLQETMRTLDCGIAGEALGPRIYSFVPTTNKQIAITKRLATRYPELAPLSALGHIISHIQICTSRTSPFICFGAHQQPHSNMHLLN